MKPDSLSVVGITQGQRVPSTRFRWSQYTEDLKGHGFEVSELSSAFGAYPPVSRARRPAWLAATSAQSLMRALRARRHDLRFLQRNLVATLCTWEPLLRRPFVFDVDDAIFLGARGGSADRIARCAALIICGNAFLAEHFSRHGRVEILPTAVDTARFTPRAGSPLSRPVIGWSGSSSGLKYLYGIEPALRELLRRMPDLLFKVVSDRRPTFKTLPPERVLFEFWTPEREDAVLHEFTVGIMPLENDLWARGKCSFKMLTYMAGGLPVVVSPVGMNAEVLAQAPCGLPARSIDDWVDAIASVLSQPSLAARLGRAGRQVVEARYSRRIVSHRLAGLLRSAA